MEFKGHSLALDTNCVWKKFYSHICIQFVLVFNIDNLIFNCLAQNIVVFDVFRMNHICVSGG